ncbi:hypothetical protein [Sinorhizobium meliloti]|uniref:hypothetical protein n=1 Tax=Rhizobium meliloti TaxID=382 RepID=UPI001F3DA05B|nr:hypothetical protein [Sinorhizobium meliloti]
MDEEQQLEILSPVTDLGFVRILLADLHDELPSKVARFRQLADLSTSLGANGTMFTGGETTYLAWTEARSSFVHGNYIATVMLCQGLQNIFWHHTWNSELTGNNCRQGSNFLLPSNDA